MLPAKLVFFFVSIITVICREVPLMDPLSGLEDNKVYLGFWFVFRTAWEASRFLKNSTAGPCTPLDMWDQSRILGVNT